jgi:hypothetical protein
MEQVSILGCEILWSKGSKKSQAGNQKGSENNVRCNRRSDEIYRRQGTRKKRSVVTCWLNTKGIQVDYALEILFTVREERAHAGEEAYQMNMGFAPNVRLLAAL